MNAVIYTRYSSDSQREESIEGQLRECREYADRNGMTVVGGYIDRALSAKTADRPEFQRMIKDSAKGLFEIVLVWKLDRFSRDRYDSAHYKHILKKNGVKVVSAKEHISEGPEGIILESMLEGYAEFYSAELSEKIHRGQKENALKGKNNGGGIPLGYALDKQTQKLVIDPEAAPAAEIFTQYADGETVRSMIEDFNARGAYNEEGKTVQHEQLQCSAQKPQVHWQIPVLGCGHPRRRPCRCTGGAVLPRPEAYGEEQARTGTYQSQRKRVSSVHKAVLQQV